MISLRVLSSAAALAVVLAVAAPSAFAQPPHLGKGAAVGGVRVGPPVARFNAGPPVARFSAGAPVARFAGGGVYHGGHHHGGGGFFPGAVAGAVIGGAIASQGYGYYGEPGYYYAPGYYPGYYDDQYYDDSAVAVAPAPVGDDAIAYCIQTYHSYDPRSGTYLGYDGFRHPCP